MDSISILYYKSFTKKKKQGIMSSQCVMSVWCKETQKQKSQSPPSNSSLGPLGSELAFTSELVFPTHWGNTIVL